MCIEIQQIFFLENITVPGSYRNHSECVIKTTGEQPVNNGSCYVDCEYFFCTNRTNKSTHLEIIVPCVQEFSLSPIHHTVIYQWDNIICVKRSQLLSWLACHFNSVIRSALLLVCLCVGKKQVLKICILLRVFLECWSSPNYYLGGIFFLTAYKQLF